MRKTIEYNGKQFVRQIEILGDVESIQWFIHDNGDYLQVYEQELLEELEFAYETIVIANISPILPII